MLKIVMMLCASSIQNGNIVAIPEGDLVEHDAQCWIRTQDFDSTDVEACNTFAALWAEQTRLDIQRDEKAKLGESAISAVSAQCWTVESGEWM